MDIQIVNNELTEEERHFTVELWHADVMLSSAEVIIKSNSEFTLNGDDCDEYCGYMFNSQQYAVMY